MIYGAVGSAKTATWADCIGASALAGQCAESVCRWVGETVSLWDYNILISIFSYGVGATECLATDTPTYANATCADCILNLAIAW